MLRAELTGYADYVSDVTVSPRHVPTAGALWTGFSFTRYISHVKMRLRVMAAGNCLDLFERRKFRRDPQRLYVGGHSSRRHLCGVAQVTDWKKDFSLPETVVKGGLRASACTI